MPQIKPSILGVLFFIGTFNLSCQVTFFGDLYVGKNKELHIAFKETYFSGGKIKTHRQDPVGIISFGSESKWTQLYENSYVDGIIRIYHDGVFTFPVGDLNIFSPITFYLIGNENYIQVEYNHTLNRLYFSNSMEIETPQHHFWSWKVQGNPFARIQTFWWPNHKIVSLTKNEVITDILNIGLLLQGKWKKYFSSLTSNPFTPEFPLSAKYGSSIGVEPISLSENSVITYLTNKKDLKIEKLVSQVITPNNDNTNDTWKIQGYQFNLKSEIKVYDLNQKLVFSHLGIYNNDWDGTAVQTGEPLDNGGYFFTLDLDGKKPIEKKGWLYIRRN
ncbi:MAG: gliding motility-associated C-terminal domain-containing protein [Flavobacteriia bacterium]|jgi:gliding motility-associated-like protein|nr:gliding motility-associated C-terminal domain-containing protein [Flavobacteriaceae bacterium]MDC3218062.1 gliding motility-associated C-terminal domain-containing protein [Flavobacteriaceae bacterium]MDG1885460.1 gliding motility-associated C-terminal domain-containing protein [Flavobacteriaceae bacterium]MDG1926909.1 gliding motility-associated C-terminal domain-containing protein [Flavobacteriaceae bacterium]|tara:strand:+ start:2052 stop:3044 length:993 start_codon:yes stop_codon:yes gene_type:complete|eukprot:GHVR01066432.1.p1 GENE.GHVR01066432.1~~GHVR01066432.1.p1  ORF type:complete len:331 (-),score=4.68 GHVR01066432.1:1163-2155(-)